MLVLRRRLESAEQLWGDSPERHHWIPAEDLEELNDNIVRRIRVTNTFAASTAP
jgi:hypothetical protein